jgi:hypothetical protein
MIRVVVIAGGVSNHGDTQPRAVHAAMLLFAVGIAL